MRSIAIKHVAAAILLAISTAAAAAETSQPRFLTVPVLGLRVPLAGLKLEPFPENLRAICPQIADDEAYIGHAWIFAKAQDSVSTYFVLTGYFKRRARDPHRPLYETWDNGSVFILRDGKCGGDDADETFEVRDPNAENNGNVPIPMLRELAHDLAAKTVLVMGSPERLRAEIKKQHIEFNRLPPDLQEAFTQYFSK